MFNNAMDYILTLALWLGLGIVVGKYLKGNDQRQNQDGDRSDMEIPQGEYFVGWCPKHRFPWCATKKDGQRHCRYYVDCVYSPNVECPQDD